MLQLTNWDKLPGRKMNFWMFTRPEMNQAANCRTGKKYLPGLESIHPAHSSIQNKQTNSYLCGKQTNHQEALFTGNNHRTLSLNESVFLAVKAFPRTLPNLQKQAPIQENHSIGIK